jgi:hypothetical protein
MIGFIDTLYTVLGTTCKTALSLICTLYSSPLHTHYGSVFTSRILATDYSQFHCNYTSHMQSSFHSLTPFLPLFCQLADSKDSTQFSSCAPRFIPWQAGVSKLDSALYAARLSFSTWSRLLTVSFYDPSARTTQKTASLLLRRLVYWSVAYQLTSLCCTHTVRGTVFTESLPSNGYTSQNIHNISKFLLYE